MLIAICGGSCTGKTTIAELLALQTGFPIRHCGRVVVDMAKSLGVDVALLPVSIHKSIDAGTVSWATSRFNIPAIVEGRFLDFVLKDYAAPLLLVRCIASTEFRSACWTQRLGTSAAPTNIKSLDTEDEVLCASIYSSSPRSVDRLIDTSRFTVQECVDQILLEVRKREQLA
jgi:cytidylate kinase